MDNPSKETPVKRKHLIRVTLDDHEYEYLVKEAAENYRVPSRELSYQVAERYKFKKKRRE